MNELSNRLLLASQGLLLNFEHISCLVSISNEDLICSESSDPSVSLEYLVQFTGLCFRHVILNWKSGHILLANLRMNAIGEQLACH